MHVVYLIQNTVSHELYVGVTRDLKKRLVTHNSGAVTATRRSGEWVLIYAEAYRDEHDAREREHHLKQRGAAKRGVYERVRRSFLENKK
ncbi:MAG: hypothetical protein AMXMBFR44_0880 [Candidatus Campbellbacteria bacterium]